MAGGPLDILYIHTRTFTPFKLCYVSSHAYSRADMKPLLPHSGEGGGTGTSGGVPCACLCRPGGSEPEIVKMVEQTGEAADRSPAIKNEVVKEDAGAQTAWSKLDELEVVQRPTIWRRRRSGTGHKQLCVCR